MWKHLSCFRACLQGWSLRSSGTDVSFGASYVHRQEQWLPERLHESPGLCARMSRLNGQPLLTSGALAN
jgi:hypothetical protein